MLERKVTLPWAEFIASSLINSHPSAATYFPHLHMVDLIHQELRIFFICINLYGPDTPGWQSAVSQCWAISECLWTLFLPTLLALDWSIEHIKSAAEVRKPKPNWNRLSGEWEWCENSRPTLLYHTNGLCIRSPSSSGFFFWITNTDYHHLLVWRVISSYAGAECTVCASWSSV